MGMPAAEAGLQRGTLVSLPVLVAVATVAAVFKSVQNRQPSRWDRRDRRQSRDGKAANELGSE
jgi:hypothetical protein